MEAKTLKHLVRIYHSYVKKVSHLILDDKLKRYVKYFFNKPVESEYFVTKSTESEEGIKFLKPLEQHKLLKFIRLNRKFNPDNVK